MASDPEDLLRLATEVAALHREVDGLREQVARLSGDTAALGGNIVRVSAATTAIRDSARGLSQRIVDELRRARPTRDILFVVDDEAESRDLALEALSAAGFAVQAFSRAHDLIDVLPVVVPKVVLIDLAVPGMPARDLAAYVRSTPRTARVRRLGMTKVVPSRIDACHFTALIDKPLEPGSLIDFVRHALQPAPYREKTGPAR
jgi:CheY-like chemotaxis protein